MKISFRACIAILSASPPSDNIFVESASFRGLMSKLSSRATTANDNNPQQDTTATIDEVVHVDLDPHAIALAETTDVHPHLASSDHEQGDRNLSSCTPTAETQYYTPPDPPACCTEKAWHPTYSAGWTNGYCKFVEDCNSPSYSSELECCKGAYSGQVSGVCLKKYYASFPNPPTGSPTDLGEGVYYPDYDTDWADATCKNDRPWPFTEGGRPTYTNMKDCCDNAYGGQVSKACITAYYASFPSPPTGSPTEFGEGQYYPDYDTVWVDAACINTKPIPSGRPVYTSMLSCCQSAYAGQVSQACLGAFYQSFPNPPTGSPTDLGEGQYYPDYETNYEDATCINTKPHAFTPGSRPMYNSQLECCKLAYAGQTSGACLAGLPEGIRPTSSPTGPGGAGWYNNQNDGDAAVRVCTQETPRPQWGTVGDYDSLLECCNGQFGWQTSKACYCEATQCAAGTDVCEDGDGSNVDLTNFDANVGCESCSGDYACTGATGSIGNTGNPGCKNCGSCVGLYACTNFGYDVSGSAPYTKEGGSIGTSSCVGEEACDYAFGTIGDKSCLGDYACYEQTGTIGDQSCTKGGVLGSITGSCEGNTSTIGNDSCGGIEACSFNDGEIGNDSCNADNACFDGSSGLTSTLKIGNGSCNADGACNALTKNVGNNSCNRSAGCNDCTVDVPDNQCNGGPNDVCPASCDP